MFFFIRAMTFRLALFVLTTFGVMAPGVMPVFASDGFQVVLCSGVLAPDNHDVDHDPTRRDAMDCLWAVFATDDIEPHEITSLGLTRTPTTDRFFGMESVSAPINPQRLNGARAPPRFV